jgi:ATP-dependent DNA helicase RecQ
MEVLIVAKTHMKDTACVGALELQNKKNIRLLTIDGKNQPKDVVFNVGDIWDIEYTQRQVINAPHYEDVLISSYKFLRKQEKLNTFLLNNAPLWKGGTDVLFDGMLKFDQNSSGYINNVGGIPKQSVGFWLPDKDIELTIFPDKRHYFYFVENGVKSIPFVGYQKPIETIRQGTIIRISLARWWKVPIASITELRCYCQLSGWYLD